jgi:hypothetical protein
MRLRSEMAHIDAHFGYEHLGQHCEILAQAKHLAGDCVAVALTLSGLRGKIGCGKSAQKLNTRRKTG